MSHHHQAPEPDRRRTHRAKTRWWTVGLAGVTGLALTTGIAATPAAAIGRTLTPDGWTSAGGHRERGKSEGKDTSPIACNADALIAAITLANARGGATLNLAKDCTYLLTANLDGAGLPAITTPITLNGGKHTTIERAAAADQFRILTVDTGGNLTLNQLKITGGQTALGTNGGGILVNPGGELTARHSTVASNIAGDRGGGIANLGTTTIKDSAVDRNTARLDGGGIYSTGAITVGNARITDNSASAFGGGLGSFNGGTVEVRGSTFARNRALGGAGISGSRTVTTIANSTLTDNNATALGGGAFVDGQLTMRHVTVANNTAPSQGGGVAIQDSIGTSAATIEDSKISDNTTNGSGGGILNIFSPLILRNTKITGNQADQGGGVLNLFNSTTTLYNTSVAKNIAITDGGGIFNDAGGTVALNPATGTVVVKNRPNNCVNVPDCPG